MKTFRLALLLLIIVAAFSWSDPARAQCSGTVTDAQDYELMLTTHSDGNPKATLSILNRDGGSLTYYTSVLSYTYDDTELCDTNAGFDHKSFTTSGTFSCNAVTLAAGEHAQEVIDRPFLSSICGGNWEDCDFKIIVHIASDGSRGVLPLVEADLIYASADEETHVYLQRRRCG